MSSLKFSRFHTQSLRSCALRDFNARETEINQHYWSFIASSEHSAYRARAAKKLDKNTSAASLFQASGADVSRIPATVSDWISANEKLENWLRLSAMVSATSNLEMYIGHVTRTALASDPLVRHKNPRALDGVCLLKSEVEFPYEEEVQGLTKGDWNSREAHFGKYFGFCLLDLRQKKTELEEIRKLRNEFAHGFGRSLEIPEPGIITNGSPARLNQNKLKRYLGVISFVAKKIDRHLMSNHIGCYELILQYHKNKIEIGEISKQKKISKEKLLKRYIYDRLHITTTEKFCRELIDHYASCTAAAAS